MSWLVAHTLTAKSTVEERRKDSHPRVMMVSAFLSYEGEFYRANLSVLLLVRSVSLTEF